MRRRPLIIIAGVLVVIGIVAGLVFVFFGGDAELTPVGGNPFGDLSGESIVPGEGLNEGIVGVEVGPRLYRVTDTPVALGVVAFTRVSTTTPIDTEVDLGATTTSPVSAATVTDTEVRFIDRASGNTYRYLVHDRSLTRLSNKTLPGIQRASWLADGSAAYAQFLSGSGAGEFVATYVLPDSGEGGFFLEQGLDAAEATPDGELFTLLSGTTGSVGSLSRADGTNERTYFTSLLSSLAVHPTRGNFYASTKPSWLLDGYGFQINASGSFTRILGPLRGLSVLPSPDGSGVLYSYVSGTTLRLAVLNVESRQSTALPVSTLVEKCVWAQDSESAYCGIPTATGRGLPDSWYQGATTFTDRLWEIDMTERLATLVIDPLQAGSVPVDAVALFVDPSEDVVVFTDRLSGSLWVYDL